MKKWIKRVVACGFLSMAVFGGAASAAWCGRPCDSAYKACMARAGDAQACQDAYDVCMETLCSGNP